MSVTAGLIEEELHKMIASGEDGMAARADGELIAEATRRARSRAGLMTTNPQDAEAVEHWESVLAELRGEAAPQGDEGSGNNAVRAQLIP
ncbi:MAG: hypothetical protein M3Y58_22985 [Chloroflexota bacterium]|nr:hypothetical protein [Chloroflexota bacterium]